MENKEVDQQTDESQNNEKETTFNEASLDIIAYSGANLPKGYFPMILSKFLRSLRYGNEYFKLITSDSYFRVYEAYISQLIPRCKIKIAALSDDYDVVIGWSLYEGTKLHYCYVNKDYRRKGIATLLTKEPFDRVTNLTNIGMSIWAAKFNNNPSIESNKPLVVFDPFA